MPAARQIGYAAAMISDLWVIAAAIAIIAGLLASQALLIVVGVLVLLIWITGKHWPRYAFRRAHLLTASGASPRFYRRRA